jgi:16S rRNA (guanine(1405)-N(7))-methyltransferase
VTDTDLEKLVTEVKASAKYRHVSDDLVRDLGAQELTKRDYREAVKATRNKLHQVAGAYLDRPPRYGAWLEELTLAQADGPEALRSACRRIMGWHASTRERLPILEQFYHETLSNLPTIKSVLDVACGLNPLAIPWMPLAPQALYVTIDIYEDLMSFLEQAITLCGMTPRVVAHSVLKGLPPMEPVDLALLLKAIPCLEQTDKTAGSRLLESVRAKHILVSFPCHSLGGRAKGMHTHYATHFHELVADRPWSVQSFSFRTELAFLVTKGDSSGAENCL